MHVLFYIMFFFNLSTQQGSDLECLKGLIAFGANAECVNAFGQTPLDLAKMSPFGETVCDLKLFYSSHFVY